jgi:3-oxoacyl-[acyl-carrier-protein] synthase-3
MLFRQVHFAGLAAVDAPHRISSAEIGARLAPRLRAWGMPANILELLTGIKARRYWDEGVQPSQAATWAAERLLAQSAVPRAAIGLLISTSVCKDWVEPSVACLVHGNLGLPSTCLNFDIGNACLAFLNGVEVAAMMIERGQIEYALIVDGESSRTITEATVARLVEEASSADDLRAQFASLTLGSGAAAALLCHARHAPQGPQYVGSVTLSATHHNGLCRGQNDRMITDSGALLTAGIELAQQTWALASQELGWHPEDLDEYVLHQVSRQHTLQLARRLGLPEERIHHIYPEYGNIGPAAVPIALAKAVEAGRVRRGSRVGLMGIGSGLNVTMAEVRW